MLEKLREDCIHRDESPDPSKLNPRMRSELSNQQKRVNEETIHGGIKTFFLRIPSLFLLICRTTSLLEIKRLFFLKISSSFSLLEIRGKREQNAYNHVLKNSRKKSSKPYKNVSPKL